MNNHSMTNRFSQLLLTAALFTGSLAASAAGTPASPAADTVYITDFGIRPDSRVNAVQAVQAALSKCKDKQNVVLAFPKGRYDFWPQHAIEKEYYESNTYDVNPKRNAIYIEGMRSLTIDGRGSSFIYHDRIQPFTIESSEDITIKNLSVDWDIPLTAQAEVIDTTAGYIDIKIDDQQHPYTIENSKLVFVGEGWKSGIYGVMEYEKHTRLIAWNTGDVPSALGRNWRSYKAQELQKGLVRLHNAFQRKPTKGNILILRHSARDHAMVFINNSKNVTVENFNGYHSAGLGILSQYSENLYFKNVAIVPNEAKGRYFSGHDDGLHFSGCKGEILVDSCRFGGLMDDPINIHGTYVRVVKKLGNNKLLCRFMEKMSVGLQWGRKGEQVAYINNSSLQTAGLGIIKDLKVISPTDFEISLEKAIPAYVKEGWGLENLTWTPSAVIKNSSFESCRARGVLVTTPQKVVIENNTFQSSGSGILIAGDVNSWYESGACTDVLIKGNKFLSSVNTSIYQFTEAMISIFPEIPVMNDTTPAYHRNIRIVDNEFHSFDYAVLFAQSVDGLVFENNKLLRSYNFRPYHPQKATFSLSGCRNVRIRNNQVDEQLLGKNLRYKFMDAQDIQLQKEFTIETPEGAAPFQVLKTAVQ